jgi:sulfhydrogenase subunit beta (sulfur reductase)
MRFIDREGFRQLLTELQSRGYLLIGPTVRDGALVLDAIDGPEELPRGIGEEQSPGGYRLVERPDERVFGFAHGPDSAKRFLFSPRELLSKIERHDGRLAVQPVRPTEPPIAFVGLRSCDLHAIAVQDRVFLQGPVTDTAYAARRRSAFFIGVNCRQPGATCFCASMGTGPQCTAGFDLALTELDDGFVVEVGSETGRDVLEAVVSREATADEGSKVDLIVEEATSSMGRTLDTSDLRGLLYRNREHPQWEAVADICLACGNCTAVCPTCFCHDVVDASDLLGQTATRTREWASCFSEEFSHTAGGPICTTRQARYRQWLTHKFASWIDQFGTSGCVGCGRCITWCPVGIDVIAQIDAIRDTDGATAPRPDRAESVR